LMAARINDINTGMRVLLPRALHPYYAEVVRSCTAAQGLTVETMEVDAATGRTRLPSSAPDVGPTAVVIAQPNFFGVLEDVDAVTDWAHAQNALVVALVNPTSLAVLKPPGTWGGKGADIVCGEGQPLGSPLSSGGPYFGFLTARKALARQMPGRIVGRTIDLDGKQGFALTLQAREQHIRRDKATSNICTNQGLLVTAATIYLSLIGPQGLAKAASASMSNTRKLVNALSDLPGVGEAFSGSRFHEAVLTLPRPVAPLLESLAHAGIFGGFDLSPHFPDLGHALLVCATETRTDSDIRRYADTLGRLLAA
ncbi:MAG: aminomethyl-transferring glycine dehydrogenase subunit GcvPA, partial [Panacagrimonas sp.]